MEEQVDEVPFLFGESATLTLTGARIPSNSISVK